MEKTPYFAIYYFHFGQNYRRIFKGIFNCRDWKSQVLIVIARKSFLVICYSDTHELVLARKQIKKHILRCM
jgi:hypothetical protein